MLEITAKTNTKVKKVAKLFIDHKYRQATQLFVCESYRVIQTFIKNGFVLDSLFIKKNSKYEPEFLKQKEINNKLFVIDPSIYNYLSNLENGDGLIGIFQMKKPIDAPANYGLILDHIQNPNNLGALLRSAKAFNIPTIYLSNSSVDIFNPKVIQSSMGNGYDLNIRYITDIKTLIKQLQQQNINVFASAISKNSQPIDQVNLTNCFVVIGNEGHGIKQDVLDCCKQSIYIPINSAVDSLNLTVAASIIMHHMNYANHHH